MPDAKSRSEPSMEEIIASISRVMAEDKHAADNRAGEPVASPLGEKNDILELTEALNEDGSVRRLIPPSDDAAATPPVPGLHNAPGTPPPVSGRPGEGVAEGSGADSHARTQSSDPREDAVRQRIVSVATSGAAAAAFAQLGALPRDRRREGELPLGAGERTLEGIVREMLRPLLQGWLDEHLPGIVERLVRDEIARVVGEAGLR
jgi:uncharacterized protein